MSFNEGGMSPADYAAITKNNDDGMFGGNGAWWLIILFLFFMNGWGGNRGGYGAGGSDCGCVREAIDNQTLISKLDQQTYGLADSTYALNNTITNGFHGVDTAICNLGYNMQGGFNSLSHQLSDCCCTTQRAIDGVNYNMAKGFCDLGNVVNGATRDIIDNANANSRAILDFLTQDKIATLTAENQALKFTASQTAQNSFFAANQDAQTAELIRRLGRDCPVPAYVVPNPNCCYNPCGCGSF
jgi:hypothetical protein